MTPTFIQVEREQAKSWLRVLNHCRENLFLKDYVEHIDDASRAIKQALAAPVQKPTGYWDGEFSDDGGAILYEVPQESLFGRKYPNIPLYTTPPAAPVPLTDERVGRTDREIVDQTDELAGFLMRAFHRREKADPLSTFRGTQDTRAQHCWQIACQIQEMLTATDPENAVAELDVDATPPAQPASESANEKN